VRADQTLALAKRIAKGIEDRAAVHPDPQLRAFDLSLEIVKGHGPRFVRLVETIFQPPPLDALVPKPPAQTLRELHELVQHGAALVAAVLIALEQLAPLPPLPPTLVTKRNGDGAPN